MRAPLLLVALLVALLAAGPAPGQARPAPGWYCPSDNSHSISIDVPRRGTAGIDGMDCFGVSYSNGKLKAVRCFGNHYADAGSPYETDLFVREDGTLAHDGKTFHKYSGKLPCP